jgi:predicted O-methyltransferase YrrM
VPDPITAPYVERYIDGLLPPREPLIAQIEAHARQNRLPIVGPAEAHFLFTLARMSRARRVLELGCCTGYSALWLAAAVEPLGGSVETIELDPQRADIAAANFQQSRHAERITLFRGNALDVLPTLQSASYDLLFNDLLRSGAGETTLADGRRGPNQVRFLELSVPLLRSGGVLLSDNVLCGGQVADETPQGTAAGIAEYNRRLLSHPDIDSSLVPIRDGVLVAVKR